MDAGRRTLTQRCHENSTELSIFVKRRSPWGLYERQRTCLQFLQPYDDAITNEGSSAGKVAGLNPLSELMWSQHKGLSLKYAASILSKKKDSPSWNKESLDIMISSQQISNMGESSNTKDFTAGAFTLMQQKQSSENYCSRGVTLLRSPRSILGVQPDSSTKIHDHDRGSFEDTILLNRKGKAVLDSEQEHSQLRTEVGLYIPRSSNSLTNMFRPEVDIVNMNHDKSSMPDREKTEISQASHKDNFALIWYQSDFNVKSPILGDRASISDEREHGHETIKSSRSKSLITTNKRALNPVPEIFESSNSKRQKNEKPCSGSSFVNWISTITRGYMSYDQAIPLVSLPHPSLNSERHLSSLHESHEQSKDIDIPCKSMDFESICQSLHRPSLKVQNCTSRDPREQLLCSSHMACDDISPLPCRGNKETCITIPGPNSSPKATNKSVFLESLWIRRFFPKSQCDESTELAYERVNSSCKDPDGASSTLEQTNSGNFHLLEGKKGSLNSNLTQISPSQKYKISERMASFFAKRLDAFRLIIPSIISDIATCSTATCFFCGKTGHSIRKCTDLDGTELEDLLKNMSSFDGDASSSWCIRCFQLDHWAVSCPHESSNRNHDMFSCDGRIILWSGSKEDAQRRNVTSKVSSLSLNPVKEGVKESAPINILATSSFGEIGLKENKLIPYCDATKVSDESVGIFEIVRGLRLSRTDIIRWMKSPVPPFRLEGFFLRVRFGNWEEIDGTRYHVACINGMNSENSLSVGIEGFKYQIDCRSISNHDFVEDELKAWWSATLKGGGKPPTKEELNKKIQERTKIGF